MKFKLTGKNLLLFSLGAFLLFNLLIWKQVFERIAIFTKNVIEIEEVKAANRIDEAENRLLGLYEITKKNVLFLRDLVEIDIKNKQGRDVTAQRIARMIDHDDNYFQARLIDKTGMEIIRVENMESTVSILSDKKLQFKGNSNYFKETSRLANGKVFISSLNLNQENGKIEIPYRPTVRFFTPVVIENEKIGIIGLNLSVKNWFGIFKNENVGVLNAKDEVYFDTEGDLYKKFGADLEEKDSHKNAKFFSKKISLDGTRYWTLYTRPNNDLIESKIQSFEYSIYRTGALLSVGFLFLFLVNYILFKRKRKIIGLNKIVENRLNERDILIKEIHHRVKNNLQVVASLLSLQSSFIKDESIKALFRYSQYRINSMGIVHEMLYKSDNLDKIDFGLYIEKLIDALIVSMRSKDKKIQVVTEVEHVYLNIDTAIPMGLLINEIITNSLKYGFANREDGTITVEMKKLTLGNYKLLIGDNGSGFPSSINFRNTKSLGLKLIHKLVLQLRGNIEKDNSKEGTNYIITFEEIEQIS